MTISEALKGADVSRTADISTETKIKWLSDLDLRVKHDIIDTHKSDTETEFDGYTPDTDPNTVMLIPAPYDTAYLRWIEAQADFINNDIPRYNNSLASFNALWSEFRNKYNKTHLPLGRQIVYY